MRYVVPEDYDSFTCIAGRCPDTCCRGWQISIDEDSLKKYARMPGPIGNRLRNSIDWRNRCFLQCGDGCELLGEEGLCDLQLEAGEEALCDTCRLYPRHEEEFEGVRELSLSLSCPEAARMTIFRESPLRFTEWETDEEDDFDEFDEVLFGQLQELRRRMMHIAQDRELPLPERLQRIAQMGLQAQGTLEEKEPPESICLKESFSRLLELPVRDDRFLEMLELTWEELHLPEEELLCRMAELMKKRTAAGEQILVHFLYVYLCGAVYDRQIASKSFLAVFCVLWIFLIAAGNHPSGDERELLTEVTWRLARTIEHDDENLAGLEEFFSAPHGTVR